MVEIVCHGLQSCLESQLVESRIHTLMLPSPKPHTPPSQTIDLPFKSCLWDPSTKPHCDENSHKSDTTHHSNPDDQGGGWNFLQALSNVSEDKETTPTYVHPQVMYSSVRLSPKSLELCTENLGNETGTDDMLENEFDLLSSSWTREQRKSSQLLRAEKVKTKNFPPPLTTIRGGSDSLQMRPHREGGRLVIEVTKAPSSASCFQAERSHGRLRLSFSKNLVEYDDDDDVDHDDDEDDNQEEVESEMIGQIQDDVEEEEAEEETEAEGVENNDVESERDICGTSWNVRSGDMRITENYGRGRRSRSRCKESDHEKNNGFGFAVVNFLTA
ncbi:hypothetical protein RIF29_37677 [Crotalaria pallida]|uniref:FAF domain-containing protein n=1 Tax=Crotalaria pallida TaxID=3830 RepID=A0AAN9HSX1_CROPI